MNFLNRRAFIVVALAGALASVAAAQQRLPVVFVHGNGDSAALWITTMWRFESNGYARSLLFAPDLRNPTAPNDDTKATENRSSTVDAASDLAAAVTRALILTHQKKVILIGNSRGGNEIRNYIRNGGGAALVAKAILCGTPNHGVMAQAGGDNAEFNGRGRFLSGLNASEEVYPGVEFMTIRSDHNDKYAQPKGFGGMPTNVTAEGPELKGAKNVVIPGLDHRETAYHPEAFRAMWEFITGKPPVTIDYVAEAAPVLNGLVAGYVNGAPTNLPLAGVSVAVYEVDPATGARKGDAVHKKTTNWDGTWGPFTASPTANYEFVFSAPGGPVYHIYRSRFPRSSNIVGLRLEPQRAANGAGSAVTLSRPRGYLGAGRDTFTIDGKVPEGVPEGVPTVDSARMSFPAGEARSVKVAFNKDAIAVRTWPAPDVVVAEFH